MKLRFRENSLRLRVNQREVKQLAAGEVLREEVVFPGERRLVYSLETKRDGAVSFDGAAIGVAIPVVETRLWAESEESVGLYFEVPADDKGTVLRVAVEKDLECVDGPAQERDPEAFPRREPVARC